MFRQTAKLTVLSLAGLVNRPGTSAIIVVGIGGVVAVLVALLALANGLRAAMVDTGKADQALVLRSGASDEVSSWLGSGEAAIIAELDGVEQASGELYVVADLITRATGKPGVAIIRGVGPGAYALRTELDILAGRRPTPGRNEIMVGVGAAAAYQNLEVGQQIDIRGAPWTVTGQFRGTGASDAEIWMDLPAAQAAFSRQGAVNSVRVRVADSGALAALRDTVEADPRLNATVVGTVDFYRSKARGRRELIEAFAYLVAAIMAIGAVIAAYSTMHASVSDRAGEIATLRAIGFRRTPVVAAVLLEAMMLALVGGAAGGGAVYLLYDGVATSTLDSGSMSQVAFEFSITPSLLGVGMAVALLLGLVGGVVPAVGAARRTIAPALRSA